MISDNTSTYSQDQQEFPNDKEVKILSRKVLQRKHHLGQCYVEVELVQLKDLRDQISQSRNNKNDFA